EPQRMHVEEGHSRPVRRVDVAPMICDQHWPGSVCKQCRIRLARGEGFGELPVEMGQGRGVICERCVHRLCPLDGAVCLCPHIPSAPQSIEVMPSTFDTRLHGPRERQTA